MTSRVTSPLKQSRYLQALARTSSARSVVGRSAAAGALLVLPLAACSNNDQATFAADTTITTLDGSSTSVESSAGSSSTSAPTTSAPTSSASTTDEAAGSASFPAGAEMVVDFTYEASGSGRILNPYIAVWLEDADGDLVKTVSLWYEQSSKGAKYLKDLQRWSSVTGESFDDSVSGATRVAGSYSVVWDGTDDDGNLVAQGDYVLNIEASREHGPYELVSQTIEVSADGFSVELTPNGELTAASATLSV